MPKFQAVANLAFFLLERTGSVCGEWCGRLSAKEQRELFGAFIGKGKLCINGATETVEHTVKVCFGTDYNTTFNSRWHLIGATVERMNAPEFAGNANKPRL